MNNNKLYTDFVAIEPKRKQFWTIYTQDFATYLKDFFSHSCFDLNENQRNLLIQAMHDKFILEIEYIVRPLIPTYIARQKQAGLANNYHRLFSGDYTLTLESLLREFSSLMQHLAIFKTHYIATVAKTLNRIQTDIDLIRVEFGIEGPIRRIFFAGDFHGLAGASCIIEWAKKGICYKPIDNRIDDCVSKYIYQSTEREKKALHRQDVNGRYTYIQMLQSNVNHDTLTEVESSFYHYGQLLALGELFNISDGHCENMIVDKGFVHWIDLETAFDFSYQYKHYEQTVSPLQKTGLLDMAQTATDADFYSLASGIQGGLKPIKSTAKPILVDDGTDLVKAEYLRIIDSTYSNRVVYKKKVQNAYEFKTNLIAGYIDKVAYLLKHKKAIQKEVEAFLEHNPDLRVRFLVAHTLDYFNAQNLLFHPGYPKTDMMLFLKQTREQRFNSLFNAKLSLSVRQFIIESELMELSLHSIPYFYRTLTSKRLYNTLGCFVEDAFETTLLEDIKSSFDSYNPDIPKNLEFIEKALYSTSINTTNNNSITEGVL